MVRSRNISVSFAWVSRPRSSVIGAIVSTDLPAPLPGPTPIPLPNTPAAEMPGTNSGTKTAMPMPNSPTQRPVVPSGVVVHGSSDESARNGRPQRWTRSIWSVVSSQRYPIAPRANVHHCMPFRSIETGTA